jgi:hypothetical protein
MHNDNYSFPHAFPAGGYGYPNQFMMPPMPPYYPHTGGHQFMPYPPFPTSNAQAASTPITAVDYPEVTRWFRFLDEHDHRNKDGIIFAPYGAILKGKGFLRITQLTLDFVALKDLQEWLGVEVGIAILIMQYAKDDVEAIKAGKLVFPK